eukprot:1157757-Pelagomonas_calceolata.AAC.18
MAPASTIDRASVAQALCASDGQVAHAPGLGLATSIRIKRELANPTQDTSIDTECQEHASSGR